jgi:hypothetical protein
MATFTPNRPDICCVRRPPRCLGWAAQGLDARPGARPVRTPSPRRQRRRVSREARPRRRESRVTRLGSPALPPLPLPPLPCTHPCTELGTSCVTRSTWRDLRTAWISQIRSLVTDHACRRFESCLRHPGKPRSGGVSCEGAAVRPEPWAICEQFANISAIPRRGRSGIVAADHYERDTARAMSQENVASSVGSTRHLSPGTGTHSPSSAIRTLSTRRTAPPVGFAGFAR